MNGCCWFTFTNKINTVTQLTNFQQIKKYLKELKNKRRPPCACCSQSLQSVGGGGEGRGRERSIPSPFPMPGLLRASEEHSRAKLVRCGSPCLLTCAPRGTRGQGGAGRCWRISGNSVVLPGERPAGATVQGHQGQGT